MELRIQILDIQGSQKCLMLSKITFIASYLKKNALCVLSHWASFPPYSTCIWWRHQMETFSALLAICARNSPVLGEFPAQRPVTRSFDVFFHLRLNKRLTKQSWGWWFETLSCPLWRHCNDFDLTIVNVVTLSCTHSLYLHIKPHTNVTLWLMLFCCPYNKDYFLLA